MICWKEPRCPTLVPRAAVCPAVCLALGLLLHGGGLRAQAGGSPTAGPAAAREEVSGGCTLLGTVRGSDGGVVPGAAVVLRNGEQRQQRETISNDEGGYSLLGVPCGPYLLLVSMPGFQPVVLRGVLTEEGGSSVQDAVLRLLPQDTSVSVVASQEEIAQAEVHVEEQQRMAGVVPNFYVSYQWNAAPLPTRQKFALALHTVVDPANFLLTGATAGVQQATDSLEGYGQGAAGFARRYGADFGNGIIGTFLGGAILPTVFHQDPRYFYRGSGTVRSRAWYAVSRAFVTRGDNGKPEFNASGILGDLGTGALSNIYAAREDRQGAGLTFSNGLLAVAGDCVNNLLQEFLLRHFTSKTDGRHGKASEGVAAGVGSGSRF